MSKTTVAPPVRERVLRGLVLAADHAEAIEHEGRGVYTVPGCSGGSYRVDLDVFSDDPRETYSCPDSARHRHKMTCKHIAAASIYRAKSRAAARRTARPKFAPAAIAANLARIGA